MVYYHVGKVLEVLSDKDTESSDSSVQAVVETWDENVITYLVDPKLKEKIKVGDIVLIDYNPTEKQPFRPREIIVKILPKEKGERVWNYYKEFFKRRPKVKEEVQEKQSYIG